jgi:hypothetical protein
MEVKVDRAEFIEFVKDSTRFVFKKQGCVHHCLLVLTEDGKFAPVQFAGLENAELDEEEIGLIFANSIAQLRAECQAVAFVAEAWTIQRDLGDVIDVRPREQPDRQETLMITVYGPAKADETLISCPIIRDGDEPTLGDWQEMGGELMGRFAPDPNPPPEWN